MDPRKAAPGRSFGLPSDDCDRPACDDIKAALPTSMAEIEAMKKWMAEKGRSETKVECPPKSAELGRGSWKLLHSMAAWYPDRPTAPQKERMTNFFRALADFYPCTWCAEDFQSNLEKTPVRAESRTDLCLWLCDQHNRVNQKLGKPLFECNMENLDERWRKSSNSKCHQSGNHR
jgi:mitochondrial FAD-linked sulfhydryl oxidase